MVIGAEGDKERDFDFLASIEILILDQTEVFLMQVNLFRKKFNKILKYNLSWNNGQLICFRIGIIYY